MLVGVLNMPLLSTKYFETKLAMMSLYILFHYFKHLLRISGGKDSCFNMMHCVAQGHEVVALANLKPPQQGETTEDALDTKNYLFNILI